jgi:hypothetical protein
MKNPRLRLAAYVEGKYIHSHINNEWFKGVTKTLKLEIILL